MTDYPRLAMTFIGGELDEVERTGGEIVPIAMNVPLTEDLADSDGRRRRDATLYLKQRPRAVLGAMVSLAVRHPERLAGLLVFAIRSARLDVSIMARRMMHVAYAALAVRRCREADVRHLHAHFGQSPATIAWFTALIGEWDEPGAWSWSFTIHGFQDFVDEKDARLDLKAASASFIVCISDFTRSQLCRVADPAWWPKFHVIRCGLDFANWQLRTPRDATTGLTRVTTVARLSAEKGHGVLLEACRLLRDEFDVDVEIEFIGDGPFESDLRQLAQSNGLESRVKFRGQLPKDGVVKSLADTDVFCLPSFSEGLPVSIMEAMAMGVPVVSTHISGVPELAINGETALTVPPGNPHALASALAHTVTDHENSAKMVGAARTLVEANHNQQRNVARLVALLEDPSDVMLP